MEPGALIGGKYRVSRRIGEGAMGVVWAAVNELTERDVALKLIARHGLPVEMLRTRLLREARACGRISHRNVVEILDVGLTDRGDPFLVMPLLRGETLKARMRRDGRLPPLEAARIIAEAARGLSSAHAAGIVHRDLKPANIFLHQEPDRPEPLIKVLDFGVSKIVDAEEVSTTSLGIALGSPSYMSPEQVRAHRTIDHRTDLWTLGVVMYEALTGDRPFQGTAPVRVMAEVIGGPIPNVAEVLPHVDRRLADLISRCLERDVGRRIASANDVLAVLDPLCEEATAQSSSTSLVRAVPGSEIPPDELPTRQLQAADLSTESDAKTTLFSRPEPGAAVDGSLPSGSLPPQPVAGSLPPQPVAGSLPPQPVAGSLPLPSRTLDAEPVEQAVPQLPPSPFTGGRLSLFVAAGAAAGAAVAVMIAIALSGPPPQRAMVAIELLARPFLEPNIVAAAAAAPREPPVPPAPPEPLAPTATATAAASAPAKPGPARPVNDTTPRPRPERKRPQPLDLPGDPG